MLTRVLAVGACVQSRSTFNRLGKLVLQAQSDPEPLGPANFYSQPCAVQHVSWQNPNYAR
jgi:hypothetical protein